VDVGKGNNPPGCLVRTVLGALVETKRLQRTGECEENDERGEQGPEIQMKLPDLFHASMVSRFP